MKNYHQVGNKPGRPGYRTSSTFKARKSRWSAKQKIFQNNEILRHKSFKRG